MRVLCVLPLKPVKLASLAEACLVFTPQIAVGRDAVFFEIGASHRLFSEAECLRRLEGILAEFSVAARVGIGEDIPSTLAFARYGKTVKSELPIEALAEFLQPFHPEPYEEAELFRRLGISTIGQLLALPRAELASRFGKRALFPLERVLTAHLVPWTRFVPEEKLAERLDFDCAAQIDTLEPVLFLVKGVLDRIFLRLRARRRKLVSFDLLLHFDKFSAAKARVFSFVFPVPQGDVLPVLRVAQERLHAELAKIPLEDALEGVSLIVGETGPFLDGQKNFFSRADEEKEAVGSLMAQLKAKLGDQASFLARALPRRLPEASWEKCDKEQSHTVIPMPTRPLRLLARPVQMERRGNELFVRRRKWVVKGFSAVEKLSGEWWLHFFAREYFRVDTDKESLWVFRSEQGLFLHGFFD